ncbi:TIGR04197 family type VII secretion effector [Candidatus Enterococcus ikei]|uniref:TIGR04197 family type VII secretion effector n=1 Tax=Candidatus Enterococcus ikei TaxID=2815326 RepID=A0ABS3GUG8_9ENTE|nr:TIGR04197 family type VII secretion effector [Enterococcus sp. DIV0869a]MBO0438898.1 TIGR04197 family type VII secretion effector [Enterococcus sp. DIV0869a]
MPKDINSNSTVAQAVATSIASSVSSLNQGTTITKDTQTTVAGNSNAQLMELFGLLVLGIIVYCVNNKLK